MAPPHSTRTRIAALLVALLVFAGCSSDAVGSSDHDGPPFGGKPTVPSKTTTTSPTSPAEGSTTTAPGTTSSSTTTTTIPPLEPPTYESVSWINTIAEFSGYTARGLARWESLVPGIEDITITSTYDGAEQPALWLPPSGEGDKPLLVILHSWSSPYLQHAGIPFAMWAQENGWAVIAPNFRGVNNNAEAIGSEMAVQDVVDAIDFATAHEGVDTHRVFAVGYSGGGMMSLLLAGRHPDKVTAVAAWGPTYDLIDFYTKSRSAGRHYAPDLAKACGGDPREPGPVQDECLRRSPMTYLDAARENGVPVYIGQGIYDSFVSPAQGARAFNQLANPEDQFTEEQLAALDRRRLTDELLRSLTAESYFEPGDPEPLLSRHSASVWLVFFRGNHEMVYQATMRWFATDPR